MHSAAEVRSFMMATRTSPRCLSGFGIQVFFSDRIVGFRFQGREVGMSRCGAKLSL